MSALMLLYRDVLGKPIGNVRAVLRSSAPAPLPTVLTPDEVRRVLAEMRGETRLVACCCMEPGYAYSSASPCG